MPLKKLFGAADTTQPQAATPAATPAPAKTPAQAEPDKPFYSIGKYAVNGKT